MRTVLPAAAPTVYANERTACSQPANFEFFAGIAKH